MSRVPDAIPSPAVGVESAVVAVADLPVSRVPDAIPSPGGGARPLDEGSSVVDFALVSVLLVVMVLGLMQVAFALHVRNTLVAAAAEGARFGANADRGPDDATERTRAVVAEALGARYAREVSSDWSEHSGLTTVEVEVRATLPVLGPLGPSRSLIVRGHALAEQR